MEWIVYVQTELRGAFSLAIVDADAEDEATEKAKRIVEDAKKNDERFEYDNILRYWVEPA